MGMPLRRTWEKYINKNKYSECQLITALNAYYYLTGKQYCVQDSQTYEDLVDLVSARIGAAIRIEKVWNLLGLEVAWEGSGLYGFGNNLPLPIEYSVQTKDYGFHSTLIVDHVKKCDCYRITNFKWETSLGGWIFGEDLYKFESFCAQRDCNMFRLFVLKGDKRHANLKRKWKKDKREFLKNYKRFCTEKLREMDK
jgi:hypothetical protein